MQFQQILKSWLLIALGVLFAANTASGIHYDSGAALLVAVLLLSLLNVFLKPLLLLFSLPFIVLTFGLGIWLINAVLFMLVGGLVEGFHVNSFTSALWGALAVSITSGIANMLFGNKKNRVNVRFERGAPGPNNAGPAPKAQRPIKDDDDVIDI